MRGAAAAAVVSAPRSSVASSPQRWCAGHIGRYLKQPAAILLSYLHRLVSYFHLVSFSLSAPAQAHTRTGMGGRGAPMNTYRRSASSHIHIRVFMSS